MFRLITSAPVLVATAWGSAALWFDGPSSPVAAGVLSAGFAVATLSCLLFLRPPGRALGAVAVVFGALFLWWLGLTPRNDREWQADVARPPRASIDGDRLVLENVRNFHYRAVDEFDERWEERHYDLSKLLGVDFFLSYWGSPHIAHTIVSWQFEDAPPLAISIETRKEVGEHYSAVRGFFRRFELYYVVADETDLIRQRTHFRGEEVYLYRLETPPAVAKAILLDYLEEINILAERPEWYNAGTHNCTTAIRDHVRHAADAHPWDWRILANGHLDELGYERGQIRTDLPFPELRRRSRIDEVARNADPAVDFSVAIRSQLPGKPRSGSR